MLCATAYFTLVCLFVSTNLISALNTLYNYRMFNTEFSEFLAPTIPRDYNAYEDERRSAAKVYRQGLKY